MAVLIDTSILIDAERRKAPFDRSLVGAGATISVITVSELLHGIHRAADEETRLRRQAFVEHMIAGVTPLEITSQIARVHASIWAELESTGDLVAPHDLWISATALAHGLQVATTNARDFDRIPGLSVMTL